MPSPSRQALSAMQGIDSIQTLVARFNQAVEAGDKPQKTALRHALAEVINTLTENQNILERDWLVEYRALAHCQDDIIRENALDRLAGLCRGSWPQNADLGYGLAAFIRALPYKFIQKKQTLWIELLSDFADKVKQKEKKLGHSKAVQEHVQIFHLVCLTLARAMVASGVKTFDETLQERLYTSFETILAALSVKDAFRQGWLFKQITQENTKNEQYPYALAYRLKYVNQFVVRVDSDQAWWVDFAERFWSIARATDAMAGVVRNQGQGVTDAPGGVLKNLKKALWFKDEKGLWHRALEYLEMQLTRYHLVGELDMKRFNSIVKSFEGKVQKRKDLFTRYFRADLPLLTYGYAQQLQRFALSSQIPKIQQKAAKRLSILFGWCDNWHTCALVINTLLQVYHAPNTTAETQKKVQGYLRDLVKGHREDSSADNKIGREALLRYGVCAAESSQLALASPLPKLQERTYPDILLLVTPLRGPLLEKLKARLQQQAEPAVAHEERQGLGGKIDALSASLRPSPAAPRLTFEAEFDAEEGAEVGNMVADVAPLDNIPATSAGYQHDKEERAATREMFTQSGGARVKMKVTEKTKTNQAKFRLWGSSFQQASSTLPTAASEIEDSAPPKTSPR